jgi:cytochrome c biogenesis protein CcmG, thiol:disulfide interchange protein DsbE
MLMLPGVQRVAASQPNVADAASVAATKAPDFARNDLQGNPRKLSAYRGKVVLLNFWATWCEPCLAEISQFSAWQQRYGPRGLQILGVAMDDELSAVEQVVQRRHLSYPVVMGDAQLGQLYGGVLGLPLSYLIDGQGRIVARYRGEPSLKHIEDQIRALLPPPSAP